MIFGILGFLQVEELDFVGLWEMVTMGIAQTTRCSAISSTDPRRRFIFGRAA